MFKPILAGNTKLLSSANVYMIKASWNSINLDGSIPQGEIERMMDNSYLLVVNKMTKKELQSLAISR